MRLWFQLEMMHQSALCSAVGFYAWISGGLLLTLAFQVCLGCKTRQAVRSELLLSSSAAPEQTELSSQT